METHFVRLTVNGKEYQAEVEARKLLVHFLRDDLNITSTNIGCDTSQCGACTIELDGKSSKACTMLAVQAHGRDIRTTATTDDPILNSLKQSFQADHALQCGYCTPGMVMRSRELLAQNPTPTEDEIRDALHGNICRCTGYHNIVKAVSNAAASLQRKENAA